MRVGYSVITMKQQEAKNESRKRRLRTSLNAQQSEAKLLIYEPSKA